MALTSTDRIATALVEIYPDIVNGHHFALEYDANGAPVVQFWAYPQPYPSDAALEGAWLRTHRRYQMGQMTHEAEGALTRTFAADPSGFGLLGKTWQDEAIDIMSRPNAAADPRIVAMNGIFDKLRGIRARLLAAQTEAEMNAVTW